MTDTLKFNKLNRLFSRESSFSNETGSLPNGIFEPSPNLLSSIQKDKKILIVGAGGLGCEIIKDLALLGFKNLYIIGKIIFLLN